MSANFVTNIGDDYMQAMMERVLPNDIIQITNYPAQREWEGCLFVVDEVLSGEVRAHHNFQGMIAYVRFPNTAYSVKGRV